MHTAYGEVSSAFHVVAQVYTVQVRQMTKLKHIDHIKVDTYPYKPMALRHSTDEAKPSTCRETGTGGINNKTTQQQDQTPTPSLTLAQP